jgi:hypothetical protein
MEVSTTTLPSATVGPAEAELERLQAEDAALGREFQGLFQHGTELRQNGATLDDIAPINERLCDIRSERIGLGYRILDLEEEAANERDGLTLLADGSYARVSANGKVISGYSWVSEWTDSDGTVYKDTPEDRDWRAERHKAAALAFQAKVTAGRVERAGRRTPGQPLPRRTPQARSPRPAARRATGRRSGQDPGDSDPEPAEPPLGWVDRAPVLWRLRAARCRLLEIRTGVDR